MMLRRNKPMPRNEKMYHVVTTHLGASQEWGNTLVTATIPWSMLVFSTRDGKPYLPPTLARAIDMLKSGWKPDLSRVPASVGGAQMWESIFTPTGVRVKFMASEPTSFLAVLNAVLVAPVNIAAPDLVLHEWMHAMQHIGSELLLVAKGNPLAGIAFKSSAVDEANVEYFLASDRFFHVDRLGLKGRAADEALRAVKSALAREVKLVADFASPAKFGQPPRRLRSGVYQSGAGGTSEHARSDAEMQTNALSDGMRMERAAHSLNMPLDGYFIATLRGEVEQVSNFPVRAFSMRDVPDRAAYFIRLAYEVARERSTSPEPPWNEVRRDILDAFHYGAARSDVPIPTVLSPRRRRVEPSGVSPMRTSLRTRANGVHDPNILKAIFLAGGPGSGKSFVASSLFGVPPGSTYLVNSMTGLKVVNSDPTFEHLLTKEQAKHDFNVFDLAALAESNDPEKLALLHYLTEDKEGPRNIAKRIKVKQAKIWEDGRLGLIIDGTGDDYNKIAEEKRRLEALGYDTFMVFVNTSLPVALARNRKRKRKVAENIAVEIWNNCQQNLGLYQRLFGPNFRVVDNSSPRPVALDIVDAVAAFLRAPVYNSKGRAWALAHGRVLPTPSRHRSLMPTERARAPKRASKHLRPERMLEGEALTRYIQMRPEGERLPFPERRNSSWESEMALHPHMLIDYDKRLGRSEPSMSRAEFDDYVASLKGGGKARGRTPFDPPGYHPPLPENMNEIWAQQHAFAPHLLVRNPNAELAHLKAEIARLTEHVRSCTRVMEDEEMGHASRALAQEVARAERDLDALKREYRAKASGLRRKNPSAVLSGLKEQILRLNEAWREKTRRMEATDDTTEWNALWHERAKIDREREELMNAYWKELYYSWAIDRTNPTRRVNSNGDRLSREEADLDAAEKELAFLLPLERKAPQFAERIAYLRDIIAGLRGDVLLSKAELRRNGRTPLRRNYADVAMLKWHEEKPSFGVGHDVVATHGPYTYVIYQHPGDGGRMFHVDREQKGISPQPLGARTTLTAARDLAQDNLEELIYAHRIKHNKRRNPMTIKVGDKFRIEAKDYVVEDVSGPFVQVRTKGTYGPEKRTVVARTHEELIDTLTPPPKRAWSIYNRDWTE